MYDCAAIRGYSEVGAMDTTVYHSLYVSVCLYVYRVSNN